MAFDWYAWAAQTRIEAVLIPAQDDEVMHKPAVIDLERKGSWGESVQFTPEELSEALAPLGYVVIKDTEAYIPRHRASEYVNVREYLQKVFDELGEQDHVHEWHAAYSDNEKWLECRCGEEKG